MEAVEGEDFGTVLAKRMSEPLGLTGTYDFEGDEPPPSRMAAGWELGLGLAGDPEVELAGVQTMDGRTSSVTDLAAFLQALMDGQVLSAELTELVFDESAVLYAMGFDTHEYTFGDMGDLGTRYYSMAGDLISGYSGALAVSSETGDLAVILTSNDELPAWEFMREMVSDWAEQGP